MHTGLHSETVYAQIYPLPLSLQNTLLFTFLLKAYLAIHMVLPWTRFPSIHIQVHLSLKVGPLLNSTASGTQSNLAFLKAANYNSKSERSELL